MRLRPLLALPLALAACALPLASPNRLAAPRPTSRPGLLVMIVVDQMRADYVEKFGARWRGGLRRLIDGGAWFQNAAYPYAYTVTCPGHATISTGTFPHTHGITGNSWWDAATGKSVECAEDRAARSIGYSASVGSGYSATRLMVPTFTDNLRAQSAAAPRIVTLSMKERTAIMLAGHAATAVTWYDATTGSLVTSSAYATGPVRFVERFVEAHPMAAELRASWTPREAAPFYRFPDAAAAERPPAFWSPTFPHPLAAEEMKAGQPYQAWEESPFSDLYLERLAEAAIDALDLGHGPATDYLGISFSALDLVGHDFGPDSIEVEDVLLRLDDALGSLFATLDRRVGRSRYVVALTADHGVSPIPEQAIAQGLPAGLVARQTIALAAQAVATTSGIAKPLASISGGQMYLTREARAAFAEDWRLREALVTSLERVPGIARVLFTDERARWKDSDEVARAVRFTTFPGRTGDVYVVQRPYWLYGEGSAASHGTPYRYDTWVPLFLYGSGVRAGRYERAVSSADIAPTLGVLSGVRVAGAEGRPLVEALAGSGLNSPITQSSDGSVTGEFRPDPVIGRRATGPGTTRSRIP